jgi:hypothetical protein
MKTPQILPLALLVLLSSFLNSAPAAAAQHPAASRPAQKGCVWKTLEAPEVHFSILAQECDFGFRKITHDFRDGAVMEKYSDGGQPEKIIELFDRKDAETPEAAL